MTPGPSPGPSVLSDPIPLDEDSRDDDDDARRESIATLEATPLSPKGPDKPQPIRRKTKGFNPEIESVLYIANMSTQLYHRPPTRRWFIKE